MPKFWGQVKIMENGKQMENLLFLGVPILKYSILNKVGQMVSWP